MKTVTLKNAAEVYEYVETIYQAASFAQIQIQGLSESCDGIQLLEKMKFDKIGYDPLNPERKLNLIEQVNQAFTYLASFKAAEHLFLQHEVISELVLNLGTSAGSDIESVSAGGIAAEVFAATSPSSNNKLNNDIAKVRDTEAAHKYVFFMCPGIEEGLYDKKSSDDVLVWSLGI